MHLRLRELVIPSNPPIYPLIDINDDTLKKSLFSLGISGACPGGGGGQGACPPPRN